MATLSPSPNFSPTPSPYITAPSSPLHLVDSSSDGASATDIELLESSRFSLAFDRDELKPNSFDADDDQDYQDITFEFSVDQFQSFSLPAEELFDGGKIRTIKPPSPEIQISGERTDSPPPSSLSLPQSGRPIIWSSRRSYDFSYPFEAQARKGGRLRRNERGNTMSFGGSKTSRRFYRLINMLSFRRPSSSERGSTSSKASTSFGSSGSSSSGSVSVFGIRYFPGSALEPDDGCRITRDEVKSCLTPCKQRLLSCFVKKL